MNGTLTVQVLGVAEALNAFRELPRRMYFKHLRIGLNAGGGIIRDKYAAIAHRVTGLLSRSVGVKVTIPDASYNAAHHGRPATAVIGVKRRAGRMLRQSARGTLIGYGKAQKALTAERKRLSADKTINALARERAAVKSVLSSFGGAQYRSPSRYAHLAGPGRDGASVLASAVAQTRSAAEQRVLSKLQTGLEQEAAALYAGAH